MAEVAPGGGNTFVPTFSEATGQIQVEFTRSPQYVPGHSVLQADSSFQEYGLLPFY